MIYKLISSSPKEHPPPKKKLDAQTKNVKIVIKFHSQQCSIQPPNLIVNESLICVIKQHLNEVENCLRFYNSKNLPFQ